MLILTKGYERWKQMQDMFASGIRRTKSKIETGFSVGANASPHDDGFKPRGWGLPKWFCIDCRQEKEPELGRTSLNPGLMIFEENRPDLDLRPGDAAVYHTCNPCEQANLAESREKEKYSGLVGPDGEDLSEVVRDDSREQRRLQTIFDWIRAAKLRGERPVEARDSDGV